MDQGNTLGQMVESIKANGNMVSNMVWVSLSLLLVRAGKESGSKEKEPSGWTERKK